MITQTILWTALPDRIENDSLHLSVFVAPRLRTDEHLPRPTLAQFPDFVAWPQRIRAMRFVVEIENGPAPVEAGRISADPDPNLWADLFKDTTFVRPYEFNDYRHRIIRSFPVRGVIGYLKNVYRDLAESAPTDLPNFQLDPAGNPRNQTLHDLIDALGCVTNRRPESL